MIYRAENLARIVSFVFALMVAGCGSQRHPPSTLRTNPNECVVNMLFTYGQLEFYLRTFGRYPERVTEEEARKNRWTCARGNTPYEYVFLSPVQLPMLIDATPHSSSYVVVYGRNDVAVIPETEYPRFRSDLKRGKGKIKPAWVERAKMLH